MASDGQYFLENWSKERQNQVSVHLLNGNLKNSDARLLWEEFNAKEHFSQVHSHKNFVLLAFKRFGTEFFPNLTEESLMKHDDSKLNSFIEVVGYTDRWVWMREDSKVWSQALQHHYDHNSHHPEHFGKISPDGTLVKTDMPIQDLEESIVDMFASRWERILQGRLDASNKEIADINEKFLQRYTENDKERVLQYLKKIREA